jgi:DNA-binding response OmpR family regulator
MNTPPNILLVEDHENSRQSLKDCLEREGYRVETAENLQMARMQLAIKPDLMVLDWMLPDGQGLDLLAELRRQGSPLPVIFLTARADLVDKVLGLELGADDYVTKPFEFRELLARIRVRLRANLQSKGGAFDTSDPAPVLQAGPLSINRIRHKVEFRGQEVMLVKKEFDLLLLLAENPERVFSRDEILNKVWGYDVYPTTRTVDTHIMLLRQKLSDALIETVRAVGYRLKIIS